MCCHGRIVASNECNKIKNRRPSFAILLLNVLEMAPNYGSEATNMYYSTARPQNTEMPEVAKSGEA
jgi:hypothetical protein